MDTTFAVNLAAGHFYRIAVPSLTGKDMCYTAGNGSLTARAHNVDAILFYANWYNVIRGNVRIVCYRPSL